MVRSLLCSGKLYGLGHKFQWFPITHELKSKAPIKFYQVLQDPTSIYILPHSMSLLTLLITLEPHSLSAIQ